MLQYCMYHINKKLLPSTAVIGALLYLLIISVATDDVCVVPLTHLPIKCHLPLFKVSLAEASQMSQRETGEETSTLYLDGDDGDDDNNNKMFNCVTLNA